MVMNFELFVTPRTRVRRFQPDDEDKLAKILCDDSITNNMAFPDDVKTREGAQTLLNSTIEAYDTVNPLNAFAIESMSDRVFVGITGFNELGGGEAEVFYALLPEFWGKGYATELLDALSNYILSETNCHTLVAPIVQSNIASIKVAEKNGFNNHSHEENPNYKEPVFVYKKKK